MQQLHPSTRNLTASDHAKAHGHCCRSPVEDDSEPVFHMREPMAYMDLRTCTRSFPRVLPECAAGTMQC